jgi:NADH-quinone oxidoreductase subunit J
MLIEALGHAFFGLSFVASLCAIFARKTIYNVLSLIVLFFSVGVLFVFAHAAFLGMVLMIVYVGAVTVFFLFAVMMFGSRLEVAPKRSLRKRAGLLGFGVIVFLSMLALMWLSYRGTDLASTVLQDTETSSVSMIGELLYTTYVLPFQMVGLILFVAIVGGISLILKHRPETKRQDIFKQTVQSTSPKITYLFVETNRGLKDVEH